MKSFLKRHYRGLILSFLIGILLPPAMGDFLKADLSSSNLFAEAQSVDEVVIQYHLLANSITNSYLDRVTDENIQDYNTTAFVTDEDCDDANLSTFCLAVALNELLLDFELKLRDIESDLVLENEEGDALNTLEEGLGKALSDRNKIDLEIEAARDTLDLTLAIYNQVQSVYPLHKEMADLIENMENYRDNLAAIRSQLELFPARFNNATSPYCK